MYINVKHNINYILKLQINLFLIFWKMGRHVPPRLGTRRHQQRDETKIEWVLIMW